MYFDLELWAILWKTGLVNIISLYLCSAQDGAGVATEGMPYGVLNDYANYYRGYTGQIGYYASVLCRCPSITCFVCIGQQAQQQQPKQQTGGGEISAQVYLNPCPNGTPYLTQTGSPYYCSRKPTMQFNNCPANYWCHVGVTIQTTCCCPNTGEPDTDVCLLPPSPGVGNDVHLRYFYHSQSATCQQFWYRGAEGNQNNFITLAECENTCKKRLPPQPVNPCAFGQPLTDYAGRFQSCGGSNAENVCYPNHWCHFGATPDTTICCPNVVNPENIYRLSYSSGEGRDSLSRWYFDVSTRQCTPFEYKGLRGNQNNFLSKQQCQTKCIGAQDEICGQGKPIKNSAEMLTFCTSTTDSCPSDAWCHFGPSDEMPICCSGAVSNPCQLSLSTGYGRYTLNRWYYNILTHACETFNYLGRGGNQNNFLNLESCQNTCIGPGPPQGNPCPIGQPLKLPGSLLPKQCTFGGGCEPGYWCHVGGRAETNACCVGSLAAACSGLPRLEGIGNEFLIRWYYDAQSRQCQQFIYKGSKGNQNNFGNEDDCRSTCASVVPSEDPCIYPNLNPATCSILNPVCPVGQWCHLGASPATTTCCAEAISNFCNLPLSVGYGNAGLQRFFYNKTSKTCHPFTYNGLKGNQNNFITLPECQAKCQITVKSTVCPVGVPLADSSGQQLQCTSLAVSSSCPLGYWCHYGSTTDVNPTACCPKTSDSPCTLNPSFGEGPHRLLRYFYNNTKKQCTEFEYSGARGNENNFPSFELCEAACGDYINPCTGQLATTALNRNILCSSFNKEVCPVNYWCHIGATAQTTLCCPGATIACSVPLAPGTGTAKLLRWYYSVEMKSCQPFEYYGLGGNQNNFETKEECQRICPSALCALSVDFGTTCNNSPQIRYAYDRSARSCVAFTYNGCGGNLNNFPSMSECIMVCGDTSFRTKL